MSFSSFYQAITLNYKAKKQVNLAGKLSGNVDKIPKINEVILATMKGINSSMTLWVRLAKASQPNKSGESIKNLAGVNNFVTFKRLCESKEHSGKVSKCIGRIKKLSKTDIHADNFQGKSTIGARVNSERKSALPAEDLRNHLDQLYQVRKNMNDDYSPARFFSLVSYH